MVEVFEVNETLTLTPAEAAIALHALRNYADFKGASGVDTGFLQTKLEGYIKRREQSR